MIPRFPPRRNKILNPIFGENQLSLFDGGDNYQLRIEKPSMFKYINKISDLIRRLDDGKILLDYQVENILYLTETSDFRGMCGDDTGLGKTITICGILKNYRQYVLPCLVVCKATLKVQWYWEIKETNKDLSIEVIKNKDFVPDEDTQVFIVSYDNFKKIDWSEYGIRLIVLDECQLIKNWSSQRTVSMVATAKTDIPYCIPVSATPAKNNAAELFPAFHILDPKTFNNRKDFLYMCEQIGPNKWGGIKHYYMPKFEAMIAGKFIRHRREDVAKELPKARKSLLRVQLTDAEPLEKLKREMETFVSLREEISDQISILRKSNDVDDDYDGSEVSHKKMEVQASIMRMRHIIGDAKVPFMVDFITQFLTEQPDRKLTVFIHHRSVGDALQREISKLIDDGTLNINPPLLIRGGMNEDERNSVIKACTLNKGWLSNDRRDRLLLGSTLAAGEGINLQQCFDALLAERQFNPANEDQAAPGRFSRKGIVEGIDYIFITILTAMNTLDDWFEKTVSYKRQILRKTFGESIPESELIHKLGDFEKSKDFLDIIEREGKKWLKKM